MIEGYCVKCKAKRPIGDAVEEQMKNGRKAVKGKCPACGAVMFKILGGKAASSVSATTAPTAPHPAPTVPLVSPDVHSTPSAPASLPDPTPSPLASPSPSPSPEPVATPAPGTPDIQP